MKNLIKLTLIAGIFTTMAFTTPIDEATTTSADSTEEVINRHFASFLANDIDALMADYHKDCVLITPDGTFSGKEAINEFMLGILPAFPTDGTTVTVDKMEFSDDLAYVIWHGESPAIEVSFGTDTFIVKKGKIVRQTFAAVMKMKE